MNKLLFDLDITLPRKKDIFGIYKLKMFDIYGSKAEVTDFANLLCEHGLIYNSESSWYFTKTGTKNGTRVYVATPDYEYKVESNDKNTSVRPALKYSLITNQCLNQKVDIFGIKEVEFGEYPQTVENEIVSKKLEKLYNEGKLNKTGKLYTTNINEYTYREFCEKKYVEYEYEGQKYIRVILVYCPFFPITLSDGRMVKRYQSYFIKVEPIIWQVDEKRDIAVSKKLLFGGVQFCDEYKYEVAFKNTRMKWFLDTHFSKDIIPSNNKIKYYLVSLNNINFLAYETEEELRELYTNMLIVPEDANYYPENALIYNYIREITLEEVKYYLLNTDKITYLNYLKELCKYTNNKNYYNKLSKEYTKEKIESILSLKL